MAKKSNSGMHRVVVALLETSFLHCKIASIRSLIDNMNLMTNNKFEITQVEDKKVEMRDGTGPWIVSLVIGDTNVLVMFYVDVNHFVTKIEVVE